jgi:hypothetical protein
MPAKAPADQFPLAGIIIAVFGAEAAFAGMDNFFIRTGRR